MQVWKQQSPLIVEECPEKMEISIVCWLQCKKEQGFPEKIVSGEPVVSKDQRAGRIKQSDIEVQIHTITGGKNYGQVGNFGDSAV